MTTDEMIELWRSGLTGRQIAERYAKGPMQPLLPGPSPMEDET